MFVSCHFVIGSVVETLGGPVSNPDRAPDVPPKQLELLTDNSFWKGRRHVSVNTSSPPLLFLLLSLLYYKKKRDANEERV